MKLSHCQNFNCKNIQLSAQACFRCRQTDLKASGTEELHDRVRSAYEDARSLMASGKFAEACRLLDIVRQWSPRESGVFFYRLLAKNGCATECDLLMHGFDPDETHGDPDFLSARKLAADSDEESFYRTLADANGKIRAKLAEVEEKAFEEELADIRERIRVRTEELYRQHADIRGIWQEQLELQLEQADLEHELSDAVRVSMLKSYENGEAELAAVRRAALHCEAKMLESPVVHACYVRMAAAAEQMDAAKAQSAETDAHHPWLETLEQLKGKRAALESEIAESKQQAEQSDTDLSELEEKYQKLQEAYASVRKALREYRFRDALYHQTEQQLARTVYEQTGIQTEFLLKQR